MLVEDACFKGPLDGKNTGQIVYIAGPVTGDLENNFAAFFRAESELCREGHTVFNPARIGGAYNTRTALDNALRNTHRGWDWYMKRALAGLLRCNAIHLLPGWTESRGAGIENRLALSLDYPEVVGDTVCGV